jgi:hypothetical protein
VLVSTTGDAVFKCAFGSVVALGAPVAVRIIAFAWPPPCIAVLLDLFLHSFTFSAVVNSALSPRGACHRVCYAGPMLFKLNFRTHTYAMQTIHPVRVQSSVCNSALASLSCCHNAGGGVWRVATPLLLVSNPDTDTTVLRTSSTEYSSPCQEGIALVL